MVEAGLAFRSLLTAVDGLGPGDVQQRASELLPQVVADSSMRWWSPGDPVSSVGQRLLIGIAVWSGYDLRMLDFVDAALASTTPTNLVVDVFDVDELRPPNPFEAYIPGLGEAYQTPIVGLWVDGVLTQKDSGYRGRKLVADVFGFDIGELSNIHSAFTRR